MEYYHDLIIEKSWQELQDLRRELKDFVLIGGWAVYLYSRALKSKDIDIIVTYDVLEALRKEYQLYKNDRLKKYEAVKGEVQIDIYLPHYSAIGIPVEDLLNKFVSLEGFKVLDSNYLLALKVITFSQRRNSPKGLKDFIDIISLINCGGCDLSKAGGIVRKYNLEEPAKRFKNYLQGVYEIPELNLDKHKFSKVKKNILSSPIISVY